MSRINHLKIKKQFIKEQILNLHQMLKETEEEISELYKKQENKKKKEDESYE